MDLNAGEIRKHGIRVRLQPQPFEVLAALLARPGEVVTREELQKRLWPDGVFVDYDRGLNKAVNRLRDVLGDTVEQPRFLETIPQRGYRFIGTIEEDRPALPDAPAEAAIDHGRSHSIAVQARSEPPATAWVAIADAAASLRLWTWRLAAPSKLRRIAVLPLENLSGDQTQEYFSDGLTDELIGELAHISSLHVISRTSVMRYKKNAHKSVPEIARELNVDAIIEGTVMQAAGRVRITAQLIRARDDRHLWSQRYERDLTDVLALQGEVARAIAWEVRASLKPEERTRFSESRRVNADAYEAFLQGNYFLHQNIRGVVKSIEWFRRAIELDPAHADSHAGLAHALIFAGIYEFRPFAEAYREARASAGRALELDSENAGAHNAMADVMKGLDWNLAAAEHEHRRALELSPSHLLSRLWHAETLSRMERHEEALAESARAVTLDPVSALSHNNRAMLLWRARRYDEAIRECRIALELDPSHVNALWWKGLGYAGKRESEASIACFRKGLDASGAPMFLGLLGYAFGLAGEREKALAAVRELHSLAQKRYVSPTNFATAYAGMGDADSTFEWLHKACEARDGRVQQLVTPCFDCFRSDPRYDELKCRIGLR